MSNNYPIISLPAKYEQIIVSNPPTPDPPLETEKPQEPKKPSLSSEEGCLPTGFVLIFLAIMLFGLHYAAHHKNTGSLTFTSVCGILGAIGILYFNYSLKNNAKKKYPESLKNYQLELANYNNALKTYEKMRTDYLRDLAFHNKQIDKLMSPSSVKSYRLNLLKNFKPTKPSEASNTVTKGASENFFITYMSKNFGNYIYQDKMLSQNKLNLFPDFAYFDNEENLCIDIEIDEPYVGSNGNPIHYIESNDNWRDNFFNSQGWVVIRFAEEQIINQPDSCCQFIKEFIQKYLNLAPIYKDELLRSTGIKPIPSWTKDESHRLAYRRYRLSYLPIGLQSKIKDENFDTHLMIEDEVIEKWRRKNDPIEDDLPF